MNILIEFDQGTLDWVVHFSITIGQILSNSELVSPIIVCVYIYIYAQTIIGLTNSGLVGAYPITIQISMIGQRGIIPLDRCIQN